MQGLYVAILVRPWSPRMILIVSRACMVPMVPVTTPNIPNSSQDPTVSRGGGVGYKQR